MRVMAMLLAMKLLAAVICTAAAAGSNVWAYNTASASATGRGAIGNSRRLFRLPDAALATVTKDETATRAAVASSGASVLPLGTVTRHFQGSRLSGRRSRLIRSPSSLSAESQSEPRVAWDNCSWMVSEAIVACNNDMKTDNGIDLATAKAECERQGPKCSGFTFVSGTANQAQSGTNSTIVTYCSGEDGHEGSSPFVEGTKSQSSPVGWRRSCSAAPVITPDGNGWIVENAAIIFAGLNCSRFNAENGETMFNAAMQLAWGGATQLSHIKCQGRPERAMLSFTMSGMFARVDLDNVRTSAEAHTKILDKLTEASSGGFQENLQESLRTAGGPFSEASVDAAATSTAAASMSIKPSSPTPPPTQDQEPGDTPIVPTEVLSDASTTITSVTLTSSTETTTSTLTPAPQPTVTQTTSAPVVTQTTSIHYLYEALPPVPDIDG